MEANIAHAEKKIKLLSEKVGATEDGSLFVKQCLDPFSDTPRRAVGYPDLEIGNSVVQVIKTSYSYTVGSSAEDVNIFLDTSDVGYKLYENLLWDIGTTGIYRAGQVNIMNTNSGDPYLETIRGGLCVRKGAAGSTLGGSSYYNVAGSTTYAGLDPRYLGSGGTRVLAKAFEVHNTTPPLTRGGSVAVYRATGDIPYDRNPVYDYRQTVAAPNNLPLQNCASYETYVATPVPQTLAEVMLYPHTQQWEAKDGCYVVAVPGAQTNEVSETFSPMLVDSQGTQTYSLYCNAYATTTDKVPYPRYQGTGLIANIASPFYLCGAYFSGLTAGSTLTINLIYYVERFVDSRNVDLVVLSQPSPSYDPVALELLSRTAQAMPVGTKVKNNADGDWIKTVADVLGSFGVPGMPIVKGAVDLWNGYNRKEDTNLGSRAEKRLNGITSGQTYQRRERINREPQTRGRMPPLPPVPPRPGAKKKQKKKKNNKKKQS